MLNELIYFSYSLRVMVSFSAGLIDSMPQIGSLKGDHGKTVAGKRLISQQWQCRALWDVGEQRKAVLLPLSRRKHGHKKHCD